LLSPNELASLISEANSFGLSKIGLTKFEQVATYNCVK